ncbi:hypothetical protein [Carnobacterium viridans]|uniref:Uncharacterized protein n=1 Tax=Carnobacterium viridans TaxID=174587 RepID=A0A1H0YUB6_9LACT|nr:hypothetical protein [Carnobacterium viridans]SDQ18720.1 hypothetical protein SAMN04487752_1158 [Carnobacterium viridans]
MSRDEFLFEHDVVGVSTMINLLFKDQKESKDDIPDEMLGVDFL